MQLDCAFRASTTRVRDGAPKQFPALIPRSRSRVAEGALRERILPVAASPALSRVDPLARPEPTKQKRTAPMGAVQRRGTDSNPRWTEPPIPVLETGAPAL